MSFFVYLAVLVVAAASALFGLDLMTAPLPPAKTATQVASTSTPSKLDKREVEQKTADKQAGHPDRALSPVYPANPAGAKPEVRMVYPPTNATTGAASSPDQAPAKPATAERTATKEPETSATPAEPQHPQPPEPPRTTQSPAAQAAEAPSAGKPGADNNADHTIAMARPETGATATDEPRASAPAANETSPARPATPVVQATANRCDIQACAAAYSSFRASDCTYQPFAGPRRFCAGPPSMQRNAERGQPRFADNARLERATRQARRDAELRDVVRSVREMRIPDERAMADDADDEPGFGGRRVIIIHRGGGFWR